MTGSNAHLRAAPPNTRISRNWTFISEVGIHVSIGAKILGLRVKILWPSGEAFKAKTSALRVKPSAEGLWGPYRAEGLELAGEGYQPPL